MIQAARPRKVSRTKISAMLAMAVMVSYQTTAPTALAADVVKANNFDNLNLASSWLDPTLTNPVGPAPTAADVAVFNNLIVQTPPYNFTLGADLSWQGLRLVNVSTAANFLGANVLTLGTAGVDLSQNAQNFTISQGTVTLGGSQTWLGGTAGTFTVSSSLNTASGNVLTANVSTTMTVSGAITGSSNIIKNGTGSLVLSGSMIGYSGNYTQNAGSSTISGSMSSNSASNLTFLGGTSALTGSLAGSARNVTVNGGAVNMSSNLFGYTGSITINAGSLAIVGAAPGQLGTTAATSNFFSGNIQLNSGTLLLSVQRTGSHDLASVTFGGGGGVWVDTDNGQKVMDLYINGSANTYQNTSAASFSSLAKLNGNGTLTMSVGAGGRITFLSGVNTATGGTVTPQSFSNNNFDNFSGLLVINNGTGSQSAVAQGLYFNRTESTNGFWGNTLMGVDLGGGRLSNSNGGSVTLGYLISNVPGSIISGSNGNQTIGTRFIIGNAVSTTFAGTLLDSSSTAVYSQVLDFVKQGTGTFSLTNTGTASNWNGVLQILDGTLEIGHANHLGTGNATWNGVGAANMLFGDTNGSGTTLRYIGSTASTSNRLFTTNASGITISANGTTANATIGFTNTGALVSTPGDTVITLTGNNTGLNVFNPSLSGTGAYLKTGAGTWVLGGNNTYTGQTNITGGGLLLNTTAGGLTGTSGVNANGTAFGGTGVVAGPVSINTGALQAGVAGTNAGIGTLTLQNGLTMANNTSLSIDLGPSSNDRFALSGTAANFGSNISFTALLAGTNVPFGSVGSFSIFTGVSGLGLTNVDGNNTLTDLTVSGGDPVTAYKFQWVSGANTVFLVTSQKGSVWTGTSNTNWATAGNWNGTAPGGAAGDIGTFAANAANFTVLLNGDKTMGILAFNPGTGSYSINQGSSGTLFLDNGTDTTFGGALVLNKSGANTISAPMQMTQNTKFTTYTETSLTLSGVISSGANTTNLAFDGFGNFILGANNTYTGTTSIPSTVAVQLGVGSSGTFGAGTVTNDGIVTINRSDSYTLTNALAGTGTWNVAGPGTISLAPSGNFTFGTFNITSGIVNAGSVHFAGPTTLSNAVLNGGTGRVSGSLTITNGTFNTASALVTGNIAMNGGFINVGASTGTTNGLSAAVVMSSGKILYNGTQSAAQNITMGASSNVEVSGFNTTFSGLNSSSNTATLTNSGSAATITLGATGAGANNFSGNITGPLALIRSGGGTYNLSGNNTITSIVFSGNGPGVLGLYSNNSFPATPININGQPSSGAIVLGHNVLMANDVVLNFTSQNSTSINVLSAAAGSSATYSGNVTTLLGSGTVITDVGSSAIRFGANGNGTLTITGNINGSGNNGGQAAAIRSAGIMFSSGTIILDNATVNAFGSPITFNRGATSTITMKNNAFATTVGVAGAEAANIGGTTNVASITTMTLQDNAKIDVGLGNFNLSAGSNASTTDLTLTGANTQITAGGLTRTSTGGTTLTLASGKLVATRNNTTFIPTGVVIRTNDGVIDTGAFAVNVLSPISGIGASSLTKQGTGTLVLGTNNTYAGTTTISAGQLTLGTGGAAGSLQGGGAVTNNGVLGFNRNDSFVFSNSIAGTGGLAQLGSGTTTLQGVVNLSGPSTISAGTLLFDNGTPVMGSIRGSGTVQVSFSTQLISDGITATNLDILGGATHTIRAGGGNLGVSKVNQLTLAGETNDWFSTLDIKDNALVLLNADSTSKAATISQVKEQIQFYTDTGLGGITTSTVAANTTFVVGDNGDLHHTTFLGQTGLDDNSVIVVLAHFADATLDGKVDAFDLNVLAANWQQPRDRWTQGDFTGPSGTPDGVVDAFDLNMLAAYWQFGVSGSLEAALSSFPQFGGGGAVPEPTSLAVLALGSAALLARRKRRA